MAPESALIQQIQSWEHDAFLPLYEKYFDKIYKYIYYKIGSTTTTEDIVSETFLKALEKIQSFDTNKKTQFSSWLYRIAHNLMIDYFRKNNNETQYQWLEEIQDTNHNVLESIDRQHALDKVLQFLDTLGKDKKQIFIMRIWHNMSYQEIAETLQKTPGSCKTTFARVLKTVHQEFGTQFLILLLFLR